MEQTFFIQIFNDISQHNQNNLLVIFILHFLTYHIKIYLVLFHLNYLSFPNNIKISQICLSNQFINKFNLYTHY